MELEEHLRIFLIARDHYKTNGHDGLIMDLVICILVLEVGLTAGHFLRRVRR